MHPAPSTSLAVRLFCALVALLERCDCTQELARISHDLLIAFALGYLQKLLESMMGRFQFATKICHQRQGRKRELDRCRLILLTGNIQSAQFQGGGAGDVAAAQFTEAVGPLAVKADEVVPPVLVLAGL